MHGNIYPKRKIGELFKIKERSRLTPFKTKIMAGYEVIKWGSTVNNYSLISNKSVFQYVGKKRIRHILSREQQQKVYYTQHTFLLLSDSKEYIISGYYIRNLEPLK